MFGKRGLAFLSLHGSCLSNKGTLSIPFLFCPPPVLPAILSNKHNTVIWNIITPNWMLSYKILIFTLCLVFWVISLSAREMIEGWKGSFVGKVMGLYSEYFPLCFMWCVGCECNAQCFEDKETSMVKLKYIFRMSLHEWTWPLTSFSARRISTVHWSFQ